MLCCMAHDGVVPDATYRVPEPEGRIIYLVCPQHMELVHDQIGIEYDRMTAMPTRERVIPSVD